MHDKYEQKVRQKLLDESGKKRSRILKQIGFTPLSMWWLPQGGKLKQLDDYIDDRVAKARSYAKHQHSVRQGALSQFPVVVAERVIKFWSEPHDLMFNPFMERMPHLLIANLLHRHAVGYDVSMEAWRHNVKRLKELVSESLDKTGSRVLYERDDALGVILNHFYITIFRRDSRKIDFPNGSFDLIFGSPPYWDLEFYGTEKEQLGYGKTYGEFLSGLQDVAKECYRILKPNKFLIWAVNDFRKGKQLYLYHMDVADLLKEVGFTMWDIVIYNLSEHPLAAIFLTQIQDRKYTAKMHEYLLVARKIG